MKKALAILLCIVMTAGLTACGGEEESSREYTYEIAMITPSAEKSIDDGSVIESAWEGVRAFSEENGKTFRYYEPADTSEEAGAEAVKSAADAGASVIVGCGPQSRAVLEAAAKYYPELAFISVCGGAAAGETEHVTAIDLNRTQAGYLAGYAAVTEGYEQIGILSTDKADRDFVYGFIQGANGAAVDWGHVVSLQTLERENGSAEEIQKTAQTWYAEGTELIAAVDETSLSAAKTAAEESGGRIISGQWCKTDETVIACAQLNLQEAVQLALSAHFDGGAAPASLGLKEGAVSLKWNEEAFSLFVQEDYDNITEELKNGKTKLLSGEDADSVKKLISKGNLYRIRLL